MKHPIYDTFTKLVSSSWNFHKLLVGNLHTKLPNKETLDLIKQDIIAATGHVDSAIKLLKGE